MTSSRTVSSQYKIIPNMCADVAALGTKEKKIILLVRCSEFMVNIPGGIAKCVLLLSYMYKYVSEISLY